jgi:SMC interacting uncharacterized protein involved in chromosome segregation
MEESKLIQALRKAIEKGEEEGYYCVGLIEQLEAELEKKDGEISSLKIDLDTCRCVKKYELEKKNEEIARLDREVGWKKMKAKRLERIIKKKDQEIARLELEVKFVNWKVKRLEEDN